MADSKTNLDTILGTAWHVNSDAATKAIGYKSNAGSPISSVTPDFIGQDLFDSTNSLWYKATGLVNTNWLLAGTSDNPTDLAKIAGITNGTVLASKAIVVDANKHFDVANITTLAIGASGAETAVTATAAELNVLHSVVAGTALASSALVVDSNKRLDTLVLGTLALGAGAGTAVTATAAELNTVAGVTAGTVIASKALVTDSGIKLSGLLNLTFGAGTATVAPVVFAAGTNLTTAAAGAHEFDGTAFYLTALASSRQVVGTEQFICLTANGPTDNNSLLDSASAAAVFRTPTNGTITVAGLTSYFFEAMYKLSNTGTTSHTWSVLFAGGASFTSISYTAFAYTGTTSGVTITALSALQAAVATAVVVTAASTSATEFVTVFLRGIMRINAAGTLIPQMQASARPGATGVPAVIVLAGSYFRIWPVGSNTVASVGNWS